MAFVAAHNILSPLGSSSEATFRAIVAGRSAVQPGPAVFAGGSPVWASRLPAEWADDPQPLAAGSYSRFEKLLLASIAEAAGHTAINLASPRTAFVFSTTKGSISWLESGPEISPALAQRLSLAASARLVAAHFGSAAVPFVVSNACISGVAALLFGQRLLQSGQFDSVVVAGADTVSRFVLSGFQAFQALSAGVCRPFSESRDGINLGEAAATIILTSNADLASAATPVALLGGAISNDANHISGPSRTGAELALAIAKALQRAQLPAAAIDFISAHGTATVYNDAMEAKAFALSGLLAKPVSSVKGALGHTLGAAGVVESVLSILSLSSGQSIPTAGYSEAMAENPLNVSHTSRQAPFRYALKTASGFGGCNGALIFART